MAKIIPEELINQSFTNANCDIYKVIEYIGKDSKLKHLYTIQFIDTKHTTDTTKDKTYEKKPEKISC